MLDSAPVVAIDFARVRSTVIETAKACKRFVGRHNDPSVLEDLEQTVCAILWRKHLRGELASAVERSANLKGYVQLATNREAWRMLARHRNEVGDTEVGVFSSLARPSAAELSLYLNQVLRRVAALSPTRRSAVVAAIAIEMGYRAQPLSPAERQNLHRARADLVDMR